MMQDQKKEKIARGVALEYVIKFKQWKTCEFEIQIGSVNSDNIIVVDVVHNDDLRGSKGSNKSIQLYVDTARAAVTKELGFQ